MSGNRSIRSTENTSMRVLFQATTGCTFVYLIAVFAEIGISSELTGVEDYSEEVYYAAKFPQKITWIGQE